ncbi:putative aldouronate transport system permease protein [Paenibacillus sp. UNC496MF]|uniref:ABC transporter permease n=1 Tax=Paenibacillus sp. UNC496MF TaxID=1502753 RepID=UPI0008E2AB64|nr:ABC transporter permease subunit [Paenibacillus sp. UNC496MF]SFJ55698.1 putative aldouronate transport system permease protein [Paenibacillus sp. UNC496MF]
MMEIKNGRRRGIRQLPLHLLILPSVIGLLLFSYYPMAGLVMAFQDFKPRLGYLHSPWVGLSHFEYMFTYPDSVQVIWNTLLIASLKIAANIVVPILFALLLNEVRALFFKRFVQTLVYLPHFLSWVILGGILTDMLGNKGIVNHFLFDLGADPVFFLGNGTWFRITVVVSDIWKEFGFSTIIYLAAMSGINMSLYEAAEMDGAGRFKQTFHVTLPALVPVILVVGTLALGNILNDGFDQIFNLYNPLVYREGDIIDTFVYRIGLMNGSFSFATAVGLFKSAVGLVLIVLAYRLAYRFGNYRIF